jgi:hypothetical protein
MIRHRAAFTLAQTAVALVLLGIVTAIATAFSTRQTRAQQARIERAEVRDQLSQGVATLARELSPVSAVGGDLLASGLGKSSIEFRSTFGSSVICARSGGSGIVIPGSGVGNRPFSSVYKRIDPGAGVLVFAEGPTGEARDDYWALRSVASVSGAAGACAGSLIAPSLPDPSSGLLITLDAPLPAEVFAGAPVKFVERVRYALYRSSDKLWYLGYCASNTLASACTTLQPVSGPYSPPNPDQSTGQSGLDFYYYDADNLPTGNHQAVARIDIAFRAATSGWLPLSGSHTVTPHRDTVRISVGLRNR